MKEFLPFLLALAFLGFKLYSKNKKKQEDRARQSNTVPPHIPVEKQEEKIPSIDDLITQFLGGTPPGTPKTQTEEHEVVYNEKKAWMEEMHEIEPESIEYMDTKPAEETEGLQFEMIQNKKPKVTEKLDFDLRKAVIYDAIMNPPYI